MRYFPINLDIRGRTAIVVGGGRVAARKCETLLEAGATVRVISPATDKVLHEMACDGLITVTERHYHPGDLVGASIVFAATDDHETNLRVADEAKRQGIPVNVADTPDAGTFAMPASIARGDLLVTVSTGGRCPLLAAELRRSLSSQFGNEYAEVVELLGAAREKLLTEKGADAYNNKILHDLVSCNLPALFVNKAYAEIDRLLIELLGPGNSLAELGVREKDSE